MKSPQKGQRLTEFRLHPFLSGPHTFPRERDAHFPEPGPGPTVRVAAAAACTGAGGADGHFAFAIFCVGRGRRLVGINRKRWMANWWETVEEGGEGGRKVMSFY